MSGITNVFCPICGRPIRLNEPGPRVHTYHREFGHMCSKECHDIAVYKYDSCIVLCRDEPVDLRTARFLIPGATYEVKCLRSVSAPEIKDLHAVARQAGVTFLIVSPDAHLKISGSQPVYTPDTCPLRPILQTDGTYTCEGCGLLARVPELVSTKKEG